MEERILNVSFYSSGSGSPSSRINLPISWLYSLGISNEKREVRVVFDRDTGKIVISKFDKL